MRLTVGLKIAAGFLIAILALIISGYVTFNSTSKLINISERMKMQYELINKTDMMMNHLLYAENEQISFAITFDDEFAKSSDEDLIQSLEYIPSIEEIVLKINDAKYNDIIKSITNEVKKRAADVRDNLIKIKKMNKEDALNFLKTDLKEKVDLNLEEADNKLESIASSDLKSILKESEETADSAKMTIYISSSIFVLAILITGMLITFSISRPLKELTKASEEMAKGNLTVSVSDKYSKSSDETGALVNSFLKMNEKLKELIAEMREGVGILATASNEISSTTSQLAASSSETAASITETTTTVEEVKQTSKLSTDKARRVSENAQKTDFISQNGEKAISETISGMTKISEQMQLIADSILKLAEQSKTIGEIVSSVSDIAEQSNLLAVNASIEAAKAGEQGKGFAVVAHEIKNLASQSKQSTLQVKSILNDIQNGINNAVMTAEQGNKVVEQGIILSQQAGDSIKELSESISDSAQSAVQIAATNQEQFIGMEQVAAAMENIKLAGSQNAESTKQLEFAARNLKELGLKMKSKIDQFKI